MSLRTAAARDVLGSSGEAVWNVSLPKAPARNFGLTLNAGDGTVSSFGATLASTLITLNAGSLR